MSCCLRYVRAPLFSFVLWHFLWIPLNWIHFLSSLSRPDSAGSLGLATFRYQGVSLESWWHRWLSCNRHAVVFLRHLSVMHSRGWKVWTIDLENTLVEWRLLYIYQRGNLYRLFPIVLALDLSLAVDKSLWNRSKPVWSLSNPYRHVVYVEFCSVYCLVWVFAPLRVDAYALIIIWYALVW